MNKLRLPSLEYNLSHACNLRCAYCDHLSPYFSREEDRDISLERFVDSLRCLDKHVEIDSFLLLGGEPLLNRGIAGRLAEIDRLSFRPRIELITNGFLLPSLEDEAYRYLDIISVSTYSSMPLPAGHLKCVEEACRLHGVRLEYHHHTHFGFNILSEEIREEKLVRDIFLTCSLAWKQRCHTLFQGRISRCSRIPFFYSMLKQEGRIGADVLVRDTLEVSDRPGFAEELRTYLESDRPLRLCGYCLGSVGKRRAHRQLTKAEVVAKDWKGADSRKSIDRIKLRRRLLKRRLFGSF